MVGSHVRARLPPFSFLCFSFPVSAPAPGWGAAPLHLSLLGPGAAAPSVLISRRGPADAHFAATLALWVCRGPLFVRSSHACELRALML